MLSAIVETGFLLKSCQELTQSSKDYKMKVMLEKQEAASWKQRGVTKSDCLERTIISQMKHCTK